MKLVLIHGSSHGAWAWEALLPELAGRGLAAQAIDLPGRDGKGHADLTLSDLAQPVLSAIRQQTVLIAHSAGGFVAEMAAALDPQGIACIIHVCAYLPRPGTSIAGLRRAQAEQPLRGMIRVSEDRASYHFDPAGAQQVFYADVDEMIARRAMSRLCAEAVAPQEEPFPLPLATLPRRYVRCTADRTIPPAFQAEMVADWPAGTVTDLPSGHSPFLSMPDRLAGIIASAVAAL